MVANGDKAKHVWLTELGWSTATTTYGVTEAAQADHLTKAFTELTTYPVRGRRVLAQLPQHLVVTGRSASLDANDGLPRTDFSEKPAYAAFKEATR